MAVVRRTAVTGEARTGTIHPHLLPVVAMVVVVLLRPGQEDQEATLHQGLLHLPPLMGAREATATAGEVGEAPHPRLQVVQEAPAPCLHLRWDTRAGAGLLRTRARASRVSSPTSWELRPRPLLRVN